MRKLRSILIHGAVGLVLSVAAFTLGMQQRTQVNAAPPPPQFTAAYHYHAKEGAAPVMPGQKVKLGAPDPAPIPNAWRAGLSGSEQHFLESLGQAVAMLDAPTTGAAPHEMTHRWAFQVIVNHPSGLPDPVYCFLNQAPWVYICG